MTSGWLYKATYRIWSHPVTEIHVAVPDEEEIIVFCRLALDDWLNGQKDHRAGASDAEYDAANYRFLGVERIARVWVDEKVIAE